MPNVMVALPNIGGALYSTPQSLADAHYYMPCSNATKTRNQLKLAGCPKLTKRSRPLVWLKFTILRRHLEDILLLNKFFFPIVDTCLSCEDIARQICAMVPRWRFFGDFLRPVFSASRVQHASDLHLLICTKATPCVQVWQTSTLRRLRCEENKRRKIERTRMWAIAQRDGRPAEHRWRPLFNAAKFG